MSINTIDRNELARLIESELQVNRFRDYCPNGLQVEGRSEIKRIVTGVTASLALLEAAVQLRADAVLVHHGYFWKGEDARVIGQKQKRLKLLLQHDMSLFAYHLPLDSHPVLGNNARLAHRLNLVEKGRFGEDGLGWWGYHQQPQMRVSELMSLIKQQLGRAPLLIGDPDQQLGTVAWCTGAAQNMLDQAIAVGANVYLSGEISEPTVHLARESGVAYLACGHHATERYGIQALGEYISQQTGVEHQFVDIDNPV
ncbi:Nif3-like dinuclear metal center hexameric protein [Undibacterium sp. SXout7W]|uniref:Nif3-like dinuclear metal center hexameric protein n=1 Tax=Undibacterium sp. SXout7W TaxID=3413049 RepID=UPI003BF29402